MNKQIVVKGIHHGFWCKTGRYVAERGPCDCGADAALAALAPAASDLSKRLASYRDGNPPRMSVPLEDVLQLVESIGNACRVDDVLKQIRALGGSE